MFIAMNTHIRKLDKAQRPEDASQTRKQEQANPQSSRWREMIKIGEEVNKVETKIM
jgi:hypothetical protein